MKITKLTKDKLEETIRLLEKEFGKGTEEEDTVRESLEASLNPENYKDYLGRNKMFGNTYYVALTRDGEVIGVTGLHYSKEDDALWGGWMTVAKEKRRGLSITGYKLLRRILEEAETSKKKIIRLYIYDREEGGRTHKLYKKLGFKEYKRNNHGRNGKIFLEARVEELLRVRDKK